ncbi:LrgB family protein [Halomonas urumqiensis]|uniref:LrgB family protein n=1 Tax=Halomonas urumqiensis TaxID=1684789 RepID=A0A2N7UKM3_9GAMM|nr:LrgB family protein [Halomonas urumqiensis]PMR80949.1 LrgB family protein [Halomonas urumqiensis]PTB02906.1 LrgB family protein [Halomonas urumqiensis]GHE21432.1 membrane protein [Halomonas urumqiensis]
MSSLASLRDSLLITPLPAITLTIAAFLAGGWLFNRLGRPVWCPGVLMAALLLATTLAITGIDYDVYREGAGWLMLLLGPATVALAVPLYQQLPRIRELWRPILICLPPAAALAAFYAIGLAWLLGATPEVLASLAPKSVTAPIAIGITEQLGGVVPLMMGGLLVTGVASVAFVGLLARLFGIQDQRVLGFVLGVNGHVIGTVRAFEIGTTAGAFASLGMGLTGIFSALFLPLAWRLLGL